MAKETKDIKHLTEEEFSHLTTPFLESGRNRDINKIDTIVLHWTGSDNFTVAINALESKGSAYHFIIDNDGSAGGVGHVTQLIDVRRRAGHAGQSYGPNGIGVNSYSIGISFQTRGYNKALADSETIKDEAYKSLVKLLKELFEICPKLKYITGHHWVAPRHRVDPYTFPFEKLMRESFIRDRKMELWKTGYAPFPNGLLDCECIKYEDLNNGQKYCKTSKGRCYGPKTKRGNYGPDREFSERELYRTPGAYAKANLGFIQDTST